MQINKSSWHYRLVRWHIHREWDVRSDLCGYMRQVVKAILIVLGTIGIGILVMAFISIGLIGLVLYQLDIIHGNYWLLLAASVLIWSSVTVIGILFLRMYKEEEPTRALWRYDVTFNMPEPLLKVKKVDTGFLRLIKAWRQAAHDAICPTLNFVEDDK